MKKLQYTTNDPASSTDYLAGDNTWKTIPGGGGSSGTVTSVALTVPSALNVTGSPITTSGTIAISGAGTSSQYIKGDGTLGTTPTSLPPNGTAGGDLTGTYPNPTVHRIHGIDMQSGKPSADDVWIYGGSPAKWQHQNLTKSNVGLGNVDNTSDLSKPISTATQTALNAKEDTITGAATTITSSNLTASRALVSDGSGKVATNAVTSTELGYLSGVTSAIQTQLNAKLTTSKSFMGVLVGSTLTAAQTQYGCFNFQTLNTLEDARIFVAPYACTLSNFYVRIYTSQLASGSLVLTLRKNAVDTSVVVTIAAGSAAGTEANSGATSATYSAGDNVTFKALNNATSTSATIHNCSIMVEI